MLLKTLKGALGIIYLFILFKIGSRCKTHLTVNMWMIPANVHEAPPQNLRWVYNIYKMTNRRCIQTQKSTLDQKSVFQNRFSQGINKLLRPWLNHLKKKKKIMFYISSSFLVQVRNKKKSTISPLMLVNAPWIDWMSNWMYHLYTYVLQKLTHLHYI